MFGKRLRQPPVQHGKDCVLWSSLHHETFGRYQGPGHVRPRSIVHGAVRKWSGRGSIVNAGSLCFFGLAMVAHKFAAIVRLAQYLWMGSLVMILAIEWLARVPFPRTCWHGQFSLALTVHRIAFLFGGHVTAFCLYTDLVFRDTSCSRYSFIECTFTRNVVWRRCTVQLAACYLFATIYPIRIVYVATMIPA